MGELSRFNMRTAPIWEPVYFYSDIIASATLYTSVTVMLCTPPLFHRISLSHPHAHGDGSRKRPVLIVLHVFHAEHRSRPPGLRARHSYFYRIALVLQL